MGYRQVALILRNDFGRSLSGKTVLKIMREEGLSCRIRRSRYDSFKGEVGRSVKNILDRKFQASGPLQKLATDVTEFKVAGTKAYLSPVLDMFNNEIVSWSMGTSPNAALIEEMLDGLETGIGGAAPLLHSDQGWQYRQPGYQSRLRRLGITQSMSRKATCLDNACMEGFFGHMKDELYRGVTYRSFEELKNAVDTYIVYWNTRRYQVGLNGMTPVQYRGHAIRAA
jgi:transposase InsO family protein